MMNAQRRLIAQVRDVVASQVKEQTQRFLRTLDAESARTFQTLYYTVIPAAGLYLMLEAELPPQALEETLGSPAYDGWLLLNIVCPPLALFGRRLTSRSVKAEVGDPNSAYGAAWLQLTGDFGTWSAICIYAACVVNAAFFGEALYAAFFVAMGVPGGFLFTLRSVRRLRQIEQREKSNRDG